LQPAWDYVGERWIRDYRLGHPGLRHNRLEVLSGVGLIQWRLYLMNAVDNVSMGTRETEESGRGPYMEKGV
jgi:hypothetical protein